MNPFQQKIHRSTIDAFDTAEILRESALEKVGTVEQSRVWIINIY
jgi:hypothetical protein